MSYNPDYYQYLAQQAAVDNGINPTIFQAQIQQESSFNPNAQNGNAAGIAQFMPGTAAQYGVDPYDPVSALNGAAQYDADLLSQNGGNYSAMLNSYGTVTANSSPQLQGYFNQLIQQQGVGGSTVGGGTQAANSASSTSLLQQIENSPLVNAVTGQGGSVAGAATNGQGSSSAQSGWISRGVFILLGLGIVIVGTSLLRPGTQILSRIRGVVS